MRLNITYNEFHYFYYIKEHSEYNKLDQAYQYTLIGDFGSAKSILDECTKRKSITYEVEQFKDLCLLLFDIESGHLTNFEKILKYKAKINYEKVLSKRLINFYDLNILIRIAHYERLDNTYQTVEYLYEIIKGQKTYFSSNQRFALPQLHLKIGKIFGSMNQIEKAYEVANLGIQFSITNHDNRALPNLYYMSSVCEYKMGIRVNFEDNLALCLITCLSVKDIDSFNFYRMKAVKVFGFTEDGVNNLIERYYRQKNE